MLYYYRYRQKKKKTPFAKTLSTIFFILGMSFIASAVLPIASWQVSNLLVPVGLLSPLRTPGVASLVSSGGKVLAYEDTDFTNPTAWFPGLTLDSPANPNEPDKFFLSVPALQIDRAEVRIGATDLSKSLIAWGTGSRPGSPGSTVVFGHSALPLFYSPKSYTTIFTHIFDLPIGAGIIADYDGVRHKYVVESKKIIQPTDFSVLAQRYDSSRLTLVTCLPAGTVLQRGIVTAKLVQ